MKRLLYLLLLVLPPLACVSQENYRHIASTGIYRFIDEMATIGIIEVNSSIKPYSTKRISHYLQQVNRLREKLNNRQRNELDFYRRWYLHTPTDQDSRWSHNLFSRTDSTFSLKINPVIGVGLIKNDSVTAYRRWVGAEAYGSIGRWGFYGGLRDFAENYRLASPETITPLSGGTYKVTGKGGEFSEMRGGITYSWKWGDIGLIKDHIQWGSGYHGANILSGRTPSFAMIKLHVQPAEWIELNYIHGWLVSEVVDTNRTYRGGSLTREVFHPKYLAANMVTFKPFKGFFFSMGNSIVYSDIGIQPGYLIPFFFYKSVDHTLNGTSNLTGQNSQMFFDLSVYSIRHFHLYSSLFIDELSMKNMFNPDKHSNFISLKAGSRLSGWPLNNLTITLEYTRTNPLTYRHIISTTTFESNRYNLGHYLLDNADELFVELRYIPVRGVTLSASFTHGRKGPNYSLITDERLGLPFMKSVEWENRCWDIGIRYEIINNGYCYLSVGQSEITDKTNAYTPGFLQGNQLVIRSGINWGF